MDGDVGWFMWDMSPTEITWDAVMTNPLSQIESKHNIIDLNQPQWKWGITDRRKISMFLKTFHVHVIYGRL